METAVTLSEKYKHVPALKELIESVVLIEDVELLQHFINVATKTYKDQYILIELILCFLKNDFEEEATKIINVNSLFNFIPCIILFVCLTSVCFPVFLYIQLQIYSYTGQLTEFFWKKVYHSIREIT